jgi:hypothetical protein
MATGPMGLSSPAQLRLRHAGHDAHAARLKNREQRHAGLHGIAELRMTDADHARKRRGNGRVGLHRPALSGAGLHGGNLRRSSVVIGLCLVHRRRADELLVGQQLGAIEIDARCGQIGLGPRHLRFTGRGHLRHFAFVDAGEYLTLCHHRAGLDAQFQDATGYLRGDGGLAHGFDDAVHQDAGFAGAGIDHRRRQLR